MSRTNQTARKAAYSLAAGAVGMAGAGDALATDDTVAYSGEQDLAIAQFGAQDLNLDGDAFGDILLKNYSLVGGNYMGATVNGYPGSLVGFNAGLSYVSALAAGDPVDASSAGPTFFGSLAYGAVNPNAEFNSATDAFIGLSFPIGGNAPEFIHYGWVRVTIDQPSGTFVINDWAYNTVPGEGLLAGQVPEPTSLGMLAAGAAGVLARRRRQSTTS